MIQGPPTPLRQRPGTLDRSVRWLALAGAVLALAGCGVVRPTGGWVAPDLAGQLLAAARKLDTTSHRMLLRAYDADRHWPVAEITGWYDPPRAMVREQTRLYGEHGPRIESRQLGDDVYILGLPGAPADRWLHLDRRRLPVGSELRRLGWSLPYAVLMAGAVQVSAVRQRPPENPLYEGTLDFRRMAGSVGDPAVRAAIDALSQRFTAGEGRVPFDGIIRDGVLAALQVPAAAGGHLLAMLFAGVGEQVVVERPPASLVVEASADFYR